MNRKSDYLNEGARGTCKSFYYQPWQMIKLINNQQSLTIRSFKYVMKEVHFQK